MALRLPARTENSPAATSAQLRSCARLFVLALAAFAALAVPAAAQQPASSPDTPQAQPAQPAPATDATQPASPAPDAAQAPAAAPSQEPPATPAAQPATDAPPAASAQTSPEPAPQQSAAPANPAPAAAAATAAPPPAPEPGEITESELKQLLVGKPLYLRGGYLDDNLTFNEHGLLAGHSPQGSFTLSGVQIDRVRLTKHKVELEGARYGLHFLGSLPYEDPAKTLDRVRITPKKKMLKITIDREILVKARKEKEKKPAKQAKPAKGAAAQAAPAVSGPPSNAPPAEPTEAEQAKAEIAATPAAERPADLASVTTTTSPAHATRLLKDALANIFAPEFDERLMASLPDFWRLYYEAAAAKTDYAPKDPAVLRQGMVDTKAKLISTVEPPSNEFAQANGVAGMALYHAVIGPDGRVGEIAVGRPIGFGLDENAVDTIRKASFDPALKDGHPVPVLVDLVVQFHIYSKLTSASGAATPDQAAKPSILPGPYSIQHP